MSEREPLRAGERVRVNWPHGRLSVYGDNVNHGRKGTVTETRALGVVVVKYDDGESQQWHTDWLVRLPRKGSK